jgi:hypothetical protein
VSTKIILILLVLVSLMSFNACDGISVGSGVGRMLESEEKSADTRMEQIISAIKDKDKEALELLFSIKAVDEASGFDSGMDSLFDFVKGDIMSWERDGWASSESIDHGKKSLMIRSDYKVRTDKEEYSFFVVDYSVDSIDPDNEGIYMLQVTTWAWV